MKIAVCLKHVVTRDAAVRVDEARTWIRDRDASFELNEPDAYALEAGVPIADPRPRLVDAHGGVARHDVLETDGDLHAPCPPPGITRTS